MRLLMPGPQSLLRGVSLLALMGFALSGCGDPGAEQAGGGQAPPPAVTVQAVEPETIDVYGEYPGRVRGSRQVEVRAQVSGILEERLYVEGQVVRQGDPLFRIEREPYEIAVKRAEAERADARANLNQADREWQRISALFEQNAVSQRERDRALSERELAQARVALAEAGVAQARLELGYTQVRAPIGGSTGLESLPEGSLIERGTLLTVITQQDPIHVHFALPQHDAAVQQVARQAMGEGEAEGIPAVLLLSDGQAYRHGGVVNFTDSTVDPRTGNVTARAVFPNPDREVVAGQFVRVRLRIQHLENVFAVDPQAVGQGPSGPTVFVVDADGVARVRAVELGPLVQGRQVVLDGLASGERVVVSGHVALADGVPVQARARNGQEG